MPAEPKVIQIPNRRELAHPIEKILDKYSRWRSQDIPEPEGFPTSRAVMRDLEDLQVEFKRLTLIDDGAIEDAFDDGYHTGYEQGCRETEADSESDAYDTGDADGYRRGYNEAKEKYATTSVLDKPLSGEQWFGTSRAQKLIWENCSAISDMLLRKNKSYGNSVFEPLRTFSKVDPIEQINVRIDDKLSRIARGSEFENEDTELDLIGYLILKRVARIFFAETKAP